MILYIFLYKKITNCILIKLQSPLYTPVNKALPNLYYNIAH